MPSFPGGWLREDGSGRIGLKTASLGTHYCEKRYQNAPGGWLREDGSGRISQKMVSLGTLYCEKRYQNAPGGWLREDGYPPKGLLTATIWLRRQPRPPEEQQLECAWKHLRSAQDPSNPTISKPPTPATLTGQMPARSLQELPPHTSPPLPNLCLQRFSSHPKSSPKVALGRCLTTSFEHGRQVDN